nr:RNA-directed DNA polymerase, eukaryota [Tanacetum cinerariifolium]
MKFLTGELCLGTIEMWMRCKRYILKSLLRISHISFTLRPYGRFVINMETSMTLSFQTGDPNKAKKKSVPCVIHKDSGVYGDSISYAHAVKIGPQSQNVEDENKPTIVLEETCVNQQDYSTSSMGKVKEFYSLTNLNVVLANEENIFESFKTITQGKVFWVRAKEVSGWIPDFVEDDEEECDSDDEIRDEELHDQSASMHNHATIEGESDVEEKAKTDWVKELRVNNKVNFMSLQETKIEIIELFNIKMCWGNFAFGYVYSSSVGYSGELSEKKMLWDYLTLVIDNWNGEVVIMVNFNEVRKQAERYDSIFNVQGDDAFNSFISAAGLEEVPLGGCPFTWCHKSATKMSKLDCFLIYEELAEIDLLLDKGEANFDVLNKPMSVSKSLQELDKRESMEVAQKAKIYWATKGDKNSKYYHGILNKKRSQLAICGILVDDIWIDSPCLVKSEFLSHFTNRFDQPQVSRLQLDMDFPNKLNLDQQYGTLPKGCNSSFIALIQKIHDAKMVKDFRPITLIGSVYKIIAKILANCLVVVLGYIVNEVQSAFVANRVVDARMIRGISMGPSLHLSHLFYADDAVFMVIRQTGISVANVIVDQEVAKIGCETLEAPFSYLGSKINAPKVGLRFDAYLSYVVVQSFHESSLENGIYSLSFF